MGRHREMMPPASLGRPPEEPASPTAPSPAPGLWHCGCCRVNCGARPQHSNSPPGNTGARRGWGWESRCSRAVACSGTRGREKDWSLMAPSACCQRNKPQAGAWLTGHVQNPSSWRPFIIPYPNCCIKTRVRARCATPSLYSKAEARRSQGQGQPGIYGK